MTDSLTPEHDKLMARETERIAIASFLNWVDQNTDYDITRKYPNVQGRLGEAIAMWVPLNKPQRRELVAEYFGVDLIEWAAEKEALRAEYERLEKLVKELDNEE